MAPYRGFGGQADRSAPTLPLSVGFAPRTALSSVSDFAVGPLFLVVGRSLASPCWSPWSSGGVIRIVRPVRPGPTASWVGWLAVGLAVSLWLILFYGSWSIRDNPDPSAVTIGSSYLRYRLPIFVISVLPVAWGLERIWSRPRVGRLLATVAIAAVATVSGLSVLWAPQEGLLAIREYLIQSDRRAQRIFELVAPR